MREDGATRFDSDHAATQRSQIIAEVAATVLERAVQMVVRASETAGVGQEICRCAIDGVDGAGKSTFADELAGVLTEGGAAVIRASVDGFHNLPERRYALGKSSPEGFFRCSYDYDRMRQVLLDPLSPGGTGRYVSAVYDVWAESPVAVPARQASKGAILLVDGIFVHRPELRAYWDFSVFLDVRFEVSMPRCAARTGLVSPDANAVSNRRYVDGQRLYLAECAPWEHASIVIDNNDLALPFVVG